MQSSFARLVKEFRIDQSSPRARARDIRNLVTVAHRMRSGSPIFPKATFWQRILAKVRGILRYGF